MKTTLLLALLAAGASAYTPPMSSQQVYLPGLYYNAPEKHLFKAWPHGGGAPILFYSVLYGQGIGDEVSFVRLDDGNLFFHEDSLERFTQDFDSLKWGKETVIGRTVTSRNVTFTFDTLWYPAVEAGRKWVFPVVTGRLSLYTAEPGGKKYSMMDTGAGIVAYDKGALRAKLSHNPRSARLIRNKWIGMWTSYGMIAGGLTLAVVGLLNTHDRTVDDRAGGYEDQVEFSPLLWIGFGTMLGSWIPYFMVENNLELAVKAYNE